MQYSHCYLRLLILCFATASFGQAQISVGDSIGIDFGPTAPTNNFNPVTTTSGSITAGSLIDTSNAVVDGVGFTWAGGAFLNNDAADSSDLPGQPAAFDDSNLTDWLGENSDTATTTLTFTGLDTGLAYDLLIGHGFTNSANVTDTTYTVDGQSATNDHGTAAGAYVSFTGLLPDESGNLVITTDGNGPTLADFTAVAAVHLTAVAPGPPVVNDSATTTYLTFIDVPVLDNDTPTGTVTLVEVVDGPVSGTALVQVDNSIRYTHTTGTPSSDSFTYRYTDDNGLSALGTVTITLEYVDSVRIDFGASAPAPANWNQFSATGGTTTVENLVRSSDGSPTAIGITVSGITSNGSNHLVGSGSTDSTIFIDHIFAQDESPDDTLTITIFGLDDSQTYDLFGGFSRDSNQFEHVWTVGSDVRTNAYDGANVDGYEKFTGLSPIGGEISFTISDLDAVDDWASIAELTLYTNEEIYTPPIALAQSVNIRVDSPASITLNGIGNNLTYSVASQPSHGSLSGTEPNLTYTPSGGYIGPDSFTFTVSDGQTTSDPATVSIQVVDIGPNFILFLTDDQGYNDLGCYGSPHILTPEIDRLADEGIRFTSGYVPSPVCGPCRAGLMTGSYPIRVAEPSNRKNYHTEPHTNEIFIPELLKTAGYTSALIGKWHLSGGGTAASGFARGRGPIDQGFDYFYGTPSHNGLHAVDTGNVSTSVLRADSSGTTVVDNDLNQTEADQMILNYTEEAKDFITNAHNSGQPFFLNLSHNMPHVSLGARQSFRDSAAARGLDVYTAVIEELDWSMGEILDKLDELGIADNTFVIFSSDNGPWTQAPPTAGNNLEGYYGSAFPLRGSKMRSLEGGPRVPYIVRWPGTVTPGVVSDEIVTLMDLFPTFMDYAGVEIPGSLEIDGRSIRPLIEGTDTVSPHEYYYYYCYTQLAAIRDTRWKLVLPRRDNPDNAWMSFWRRWQDRVDEVELYDLDKDPEETTNLAPWHPEVVQRLLEQVEVARAELGDKDRIGSGARFFDGNTPRPDIDAYNTSASQPYVNEPLTGLPSAVRTGADTVLVSYDQPGAFSSVELVWAYADQGQKAASVWEAAAGGGSADLGAIGAGAPIEHELTGLNPFREYIYRFILTDGSGTRWSIPAPIYAEASSQIAYEIGIDFSDGGNTDGSGPEPGWNVINSNGTVSTVFDIRNGQAIPGLSIQTSGITGGELADTDVGFGVADYGNYLDTPFSDLSANDGVQVSSGTTVTIVGVDDGYAYDIQVIAMPSADTSLTDLTIGAGGTSTVRTYASFRPYINNDPAPFTNSDFVLTSPFYSRPILVPAVFNNTGTDGSGNLVITLSDNEAMALNAIHITARAMRPRAKFEGSTAFQMWLDPIPNGQTFHVRSTEDLSNPFLPMNPAQQITSETAQPLNLPIAPGAPRMFFQVHDGEN